MFMAQHFGLKTKLLDWSSNPLVALYFSVENIISKKRDETLGVVWGLKVSGSYFLTPKAAGHPDYFKEGDEFYKNEDNKKRDWYILNPAPITPRISNQSGKFSYHPDSKQLVTDNEDMSERNRELVMFCVGPNGKKNVNENIRKHLGIMNIHHASMFPDHAGIANFINDELQGLNPDDNDPAYVNS